VSSSTQIRLERARGPEYFPGNLTRREREVIEALAEYGCRKLAAWKLGIAECTLKDHLKVCNRKAGVRSALHLVARYLKATLKAA